MPVSVSVAYQGQEETAYHEKKAPITWEKCTIRRWLNNQFLNKAFTKNEQKGILLTDMDNSKSHGSWGTKGGKNTRDKVFLLSYSEVNKHLGVTRNNNTNTRVSPTAYAAGQGAYMNSGFKTEDGETAGWWWLRSPGYSQHSAALVSTDGSLRYNYVNDTSGCIRPALWIDLESGIF